MAEKNDTPWVTLSPLGGLGQIGLNCMLLETADSAVLIDCGLMFPDEVHLGVDVVIPRFDFLLEKKHKLKAVVLTHGHEDHIGALPWLLKEMPEVPLYSSPFTLALVRNKLREHDLADTVTLCPMEPRQSAELGDFRFHFFPVCHSIIKGYGLGIETPVGRFVHTGDFKIDRNPLGEHATDLEAFGDFAAGGVTLLMSDSTNVERDGYALTEREIRDSLDDIFTQADGRILVTLFSSHVQRIQEIFELAHRYGRKVAVSVRSLNVNIETARELGYLEFADEDFVSLEDLAHLPDDKVVLLVTGSQGEPMSALTRLAEGDHRQLRVHKGDLVVMSSRFIPGNTKAITKVINKLYKLGAEVLNEKVQAIHASGHAHKEELRTMLETVHPKFFIPVHGEYRHLHKHIELARECGVAPERCFLLENGQPVTLFKGEVRLEDPIGVESVLVDGKGVGDVGRTILKERRLLGDEGMVVALLVIEEATGEIILGPQVQSKGFVFERHFSHVLDDAKEVMLDVYANMPKGASQKMENRIKSALRRHFRKVLDRDPVIVPLVITV